MSSRLQSHLDKAEGYLDLGLLEEAENALEELEPEDRLSIDVWRLRCRLYQAANQWEAVQEVAKHLVSLAPDVLDHWLWTAQATQKVQNILAARRILVLAQRYHEGHPLIEYQLAVYACGKGI